MMAYSCMRIFDPWHFLFVLTAPVLVYMLYIVWKEGKTPECYPRLLSLMILDFAITTGCLNFGGETVSTTTRFVVEQTSGSFAIYSGIHKVPNMVAGSAYVLGNVCYCLDARIL